MFRHEQNGTATDGLCLSARAVERDGVPGLTFVECPVRSAREVGRALARARELAAAGRPVRVNVWLDRTDFREGSLSM